MAQGRNQLDIDVVANIRAAQKQINALVSQPYTLNLTTKGGGISAPLGKIKGQLGEFEKSLEASNARVIAFGASASAIYAVEKALSESVKAAIEVEKALVDINVILNLSSKSLNEFGTNLFNIAKNTGNTFSTVAAAATELSRQGLGVTETLKRTQDALILTRLSGLGAAESVNAITASLNGFQKAALSSTDIINKLAAVDANFAVSSGDLAEAIKRVGSSAEDAGVSFDQLLAIVTSAQQITARGGAVIGNSFKTIFTRLERPKVLDALQQLGIETQTLAGNTRPVIDILTELANKYDTLNDRQKSSIAEQVGGVFQINILKAALGDLSKEYSIYSQALSISSGASNEAIKRNEQLNTTLAATLNKTLANLTAAGAKIGELSLAPALKKVMGGLNTALESFTGGDSEDVGNKIGEGLLRGLGNFLSGPGLIVGARALFTIFERLTTFSADAVKTLLGLNTQAAEQAQIQEQITNLLSKNPQIIAQIASGQTTVEAVQLSILNTIKAQTLAMQQQVTLAKSLAASLSAAGVSIGKTGAGKGTLQVRSGGFIPNLFGEEEQNARSMGAVNPRAQISQGTIGGKKFIKNNKEIEVVGAGRNGDSAVIPTYGSIGDKRQKEYYDKLKFLGFVPNFAKSNQEKMQKNIYAAYRKINPAMLIAEGDQSVGTLKYKDATLQYPIIPLSKAGVESEKSIYQQFNSKEAIDKISRMVLDGATNYINSIGYKPPAQKITTDSLVGLFSKNSKYKGAYGALQAFIGAAFEVGTGEALGVKAAASDGGDFDVRNSSNIAKVRKYFPGNYNVADFKVSGSKTNRGSMSDKIKKDLDTLLPNLDIIRQGEKEAIKGKSLSSAKKTLQEYRQNLLVGDQRTITARNPSGTSPLDKLIAAKKAKGFIPNFAVFNANKHIQRGGFVGRSNKSTAQGLSSLISLMGINYSGPITKQNLTQLFSSKENKKKLYEFLKKQPILIKQYPELYSEVKDGNHRFELAQLAGIKNIPVEYLAKGFIPNFASIKDAMETEKKMGGNPALDFQEGIGLYVRDKNTQSNFSAVKRDHPEGINNAIKNSKMAQETLARGFIPNFAPSGGAAAAASAASSSKAMRGLQAKMLAASFAFSTLQGVVETFNRDGKSAFGNIISGISQGASTFSSIATVIPGQVGLVVGAIVGVVQAIDSIKDSFKAAALSDIIKNGELAAEGLNKLSDASQAYAQAFEKLTEISSNSASSAQDIIKAQQKLQEALLDLPLQYREQYASAKNLTEMQNIMGQALAEKRKEAMQKQSAADLAKDVEKQGKTRNFIGDFVRDMNDKLGLTGKSTTSGGTIAGLGGLASIPGIGALLAGAETATNFGKKTIQGKKDKGIFTGSQFGEQLATERASNIFKGLDPQFAKDLASGVIKADQSGEQWIATLQRYGAGVDELVSAQAILNNDQADGVADFKMLSDALVKVSETTTKANDNLNKVSKDQKKQLADDEQKIINTRKQIEAEKAAAEAIEIRTAATLKASMEEKKLATYRQSSMNKIATEAEKSRLQTKEPFITEESMARGNAQVTANQANNDYGIKVQESNNKAIEEMTNQLTTSIDNQIEELKKSEGRGGEAVTKEIEKLKGARGQISNIIKSGGTADQVSNKFQELAGKGNLELPDLQKLAVQNGVIIQDARAEAAKAEVDRQEQIQIAKDQLKAQLQQLRDQKLLKGGGGIQGFLNPETLKDPLEKFTQGLEGMQAGRKTGLGMMEARGSLQAGMSLQELTGGLGSDKLNKSLRDKVVPAMAAQKKQMFNDIASQAEGAGNKDLAQVARDAASEAQAMAEKQFDNQFKLEDYVAQINTNVAALAKGGVESQTTGGIQQGIDQASTTMNKQTVATSIATNPTSTVTNATPAEGNRQYYPDGTPIPTEEERYKMVHAPTMTKEQQIEMNKRKEKESADLEQQFRTGIFPKDTIANEYKEPKPKPLSNSELVKKFAEGATNEVTPFLYKDQFFKTEKDLERYRSSAQGGFDPVADAYAEKQAKKKNNVANIGAGPSSATPITAGTYAANVSGNSNTGNNLTTPQVNNSIKQNNAAQEEILKKRDALAGKNDPESNKQRAQLDKNLNTLRDQQKAAGTAGKEAGMRERPAQEIERQQKGRPLSSNQNDQGQGDKSQKLADAIDKNTKATTESKSEVNVAFTPISVEVKGSIETASDQLSQKTMDAIQKAVEQLAPGIMAKLKGPPTRESGASNTVTG